MGRITRHRKLFPALTQANQTQDCTGFCDPYASFLYLSPPPPSFGPQPPPPLPPPPSYSTESTTYQTIQIPPYVIILASLLAGLSLFGGYYFVVACRHGSLFPRFRSQTPHRPSGDGGSGEGEEEEDDQREFLELRRNTPVVTVDHPIWYIATVGLHQAVINSITAFKYRVGEGLIEGTECSVCLAEFLPGDTLRLLPKCSHAFHIPCIDTWLRSHTNCPLCRAPIVPDPQPPSAAAGHQSLASTNRSSHDSGPTGENRVGSFGRSAGESVRIGGEVAAEVDDFRIDSKQTVGLGLDSDLGLDDASRVGRSFSMDHMRHLSLNSINGVGGSSSDDQIADLDKSASSSLGQPSPPRPETAASGKRSLSCGDGAEFFPRKSGTHQYQNSAAVLPL